MIIGELTETYPPMLDGVGRVTMAYCQNLEKAGHTAYFISPDDRAHTRLDGLNTLLYGGIPIPGQNYRLGFPRLSRKFEKRIMEIPFDILHSHSPFVSAGIVQRITEKRKDIPIVATFHSKYYDDFYKATHSRWIANCAKDYIVRVYNRFDAVWSVNEETAAVLHDYGYQGEIFVAPNGTDLHEINRERAAEMKRRLGLPEDMPTLLFVGQIDMKKNIHSVMRACALLKKEGQPFALLLAGQGPDLSRLEKLRDELDIAGQTHFLGFISDGEELSSLYTLADLFVFPSVYDNAPMVIREAAANGTPSILVRGSCAAEAVEDGVNGYLCEDSPESIAQRIREALPTAARVGAKARETIPRPWSEIIRTVLEQYTDLIERKKAKVSGR